MINEKLALGAIQIQSFVTASQGELSAIDNATNTQATNCELTRGATVGAPQCGANPPTTTCGAEGTKTPNDPNLPRSLWIGCPKPWEKTIINITKTPYPSPTDVFPDDSGGGYIGAYWELNPGVALTICVGITIFSPVPTGGSDDFRCGTRHARCSPNNYTYYYMACENDSRILHCNTGYLAAGCNDGSEIRFDNAGCMHIQKTQWTQLTLFDMTNDLFRIYCP